MARFTQQTTLQAEKGKGAALREKFLEAAELQRENPACEVMLVAVQSGEPDTVHLFEIWTSQAEWKRARDSEAIADWAKGMPALVARSPESVELDLLDGKGI